MKFTCSILSAGFTLLAVATAASLDTVYHIRVKGSNTAYDNSVLTVKDDTGANTSSSPIGVWSTGEPRWRYTFTLSPNPGNSFLYELKGTLRQTHLVFNGHPVAMGIYDIPIGNDPIATEENIIATNRWHVIEEAGIMKLEYGIAEVPSGGFMGGAGSWRMCRGDSQIDWAIYWFDGLHNLNNYVKNCESGISLLLEKADAASPTSGFITGVTAPTATSGPYITGVGAPNVTATRSGKPGASATRSANPSLYTGSASANVASTFAVFLGIVAALVL